ncbi:MAG: helix-turn-helix transcriptional regulator, partial [Novosphingobium sp.]|nr:helix-turn-helix transcriptional regulator [Novosphingobium sp.]
VELGAGDAVFVLSGEAHALRTTSEAKATTHEFLREERQVDIPPTVPLTQGEPVATRILSGRLQVDWPGEAKRPALPSFMMVDREATGPVARLLQPHAIAHAGLGAGSAALLTRLASLLLVASLRSDPGCRQIFSPVRNDPITEAIHLIEGNPAASWTVEKLARAVGMGRSNFAAHFTQSVGRAPMEVVAEHRMEHAASLLRQGSLKIAEISEMAGYSSEAAFSRRFTRYFGLSPSQMRERARARDDAESPAKPARRKFLSSRLLEGAAMIGRRVVSPSPSAKPASPGKPRSPFLRLGARD